MKLEGWGFSRRAAGAWFAAALVSGIVFSVSLTALNMWVNPDERGEFVEEIAILSGAGIVGYAAIGAVVFLLTSVFARLWRAWPRPWLEAVVAAAVSYAITRPWLMDISITTIRGDSPPHLRFAQTVAADVTPVVCGVILALVYRAIAGRGRK